MTQYQSLPFRIFLIFISLLFIPLLIDAFILINRNYEEAIDDAQNILLINSGLREFPLSEILPSHSPTAPLIMYALKLNEHFPQKASHELDERLDDLAKHGDFSALILLSYDKKSDSFHFVGSSQQEKVIGNIDADFINSFSNSRSSFTAIWLAGKKDYHFLNVYYVYSKEKELLGAVLVYTNISKKLNFLLLPNLTELPIFFAILLPSSIIFNASDPELEMNYFAELDPLSQEQMSARIQSIREQDLTINDLPSHNLPILRQKRSFLGDYRFFEFPWRGEPHIAHISEIDKRGYYILTYVSKNNVLRNVLADFLHIYGAYFIILLCGGAITFLLIKRLARPLNNLSLVMEKVGLGNKSLRAPFDAWGFEINLLSKTFNDMLDSLQQKKKIAEEERIKQELYKKELELGEEVQQKLYLKKKNLSDAIDVSTRYLPALEVGGDFCDLFRIDNRIVLMIADAAGKGVEACFYSLIVRSLLRILSQEITDTASVINKANTLFLRDVEKTAFFVTVFLAFYDLNTGVMTYYSGGHNPPIILKKSGNIEILEKHGPALGIGLDANICRSEQVLLEEEDVIVFYTDGVTEAHNSQKKLFSEERLISVIKKYGHLSAENLNNAIIQEIHTFENGALQHDDITIIVMKLCKRPHV